MKHLLDVGIAVELGIEKAILIENIVFWVVDNKAKNRHYINGKYWTYNSADSYAKLFPYMKQKSIWRWLDELVKDGYLEKGIFNKVAYDKTMWYTPTGKLASLLASYANMGLEWLSSAISQNEKSMSQNEKSKSQNEKPIPDINTDINTDIKQNSIISFSDEKGERDFSSPLDTKATGCEDQQNSQGTNADATVHLPAAQDARPENEVSENLSHSETTRNTSSHHDEKSVETRGVVGDEQCATGENTDPILQYLSKVKPSKIKRRGKVNRDWIPETIGVELENRYKELSKVSQIIVDNKWEAQWELLMRLEEGIAYETILTYAKITGLAIQVGIEDPQYIKRLGRWVRDIDFTPEYLENTYITSILQKAIAIGVEANIKDMTQGKKWTIRDFASILGMVDEYDNTTLEFRKFYKPRHSNLKHNLETKYAR